MTVFADDARRIIQNMPRRVPRYAGAALRDQAWATAQAARAATKWLQEVNGDPKLGRPKFEVRQEIYGEAEAARDDLMDTEMKDEKGETPQEREVKIEDPRSTGMPRSYLEGLSDIEFRIASQIAFKDKVAFRWEVIGRHTGTLIGRPATGGDVTVAGITILTFADTRDEEGNEVLTATEEWSCWDLPSALQQIGALP
jgi:hypothetical protein